MNKQKFLFYCIACLITYSSFAQLKTVTLDYYYNNEFQKNKSGVETRFHYTWEDAALSGYSQWGFIFKQKCASLKNLEAELTKENLQGSDIYIVSDPDTKKITPCQNHQTLYQ